LIDSLKRYLQNLPGPSINEKILVIESDDWGSIRMPSKGVFDILQQRGYQPETDPYLKFDSLASEDDLTNLFDTLHSVKNSNGESPIITANAVMANPDFDKIRNSGFQDYHYELFTDTLKKYPHHQNSLALWKEGNSNYLFHPQFHGREHLNGFQWMKSLQNEDELLMEAFDLNMISISSVDKTMRFSYMEGLDYFSKEEKEVKNEILEEGLNMFSKTFGYNSKSFIANCYIWDEANEKCLNSNEVKLIQGISNQIIPELNGGHRHRTKRHYFGQRNSLGQYYSIRNVFFEPSLSPKFNWVDDAMRRINIAFNCKKPAVIGTHRLNYIGHIHEQNRTANLSLLKSLLSKVVKKWPDIKFVTSDQLLKFL